MKKININDIINPIYKITSDSYENIFNVYESDDGYYFYNILKRVCFPIDLNPNIYNFYETKPKDSYPLISWKHYNTIKLWWLVCATNQIINSVEQPKIGTILKIIKPFYVRQILSTIETEKK